MDNLSIFVLLFVVFSACDTIPVDADCGDNDSVHLRSDDIGIGKVIDGKVARAVCDILGYAKRGVGFRISLPRSILSRSM